VTNARRLVVVVWITLAVAYGLFFSFSIFFVPLIQEFRWSRGLTAGAMSVSAIVQGLFAPLAGVLADRFGPRPMIITGVLLLAGASALASTIQAPWHLYLYTGVLGALGLVALGWVPMGLLLSRWFQARRGRMAGVAFSGMGFGVFVIGPVTQWLIAATSWRTASLILGLAALVVLLPLVLWGIRDPAPREAPAADRARVAGGADTATPARPDATLRDALRSPTFWALFAAYFFTPLAVFPVATHAVAFAVDQGYPPMLAASAYGSMGLMSTVGRAGFGVLADRLGGPLAATLSFGCTAGGAAALLALEAIPGVGWLIVFAVLFGLGFGARGPIITAIASEWFAGRRFGVIYGVLNLGNGLAGAIGPWFGGVVHDVSGSYRIAFIASIVFCACGSACFWLARRRTP
jgi:MFS family permease